MTSLAPDFGNSKPPQLEAQVGESAQLEGIVCIDIMETSIARTSTEEDKELNAVNGNVE